MPMNAIQIREAKARTRRHVATALAHLSASRRRDASVAVAQRLMGLECVRRAKTLMVFLSLPTEIDTWPIIRWAWHEGKRVLVPHVEAEAGEPGPLQARNMTAVALDPADVEGVAAHPAVRPGPLGVLEVRDGRPVPPSEIDVVLVPCQAVDRRGNRLGRGGGFFDRFLSRTDLRAESIVMAFDEQVLDEVPVSETDCRVRRIVTDRESLLSEP